jgi:hypothetical protein
MLVVVDAGCIAAEMLLGFPLFKGKSHLDQMQVSPQYHS